jgi:hypothetical protein
MRIADQGDLEGVGAPTSPQMPLCLADEAGAAHPVGGNLGHPGDVDKNVCTKLHQWSCTGALHRGHHRSQANEPNEQSQGSRKAARRVRPRFGLSPRYEGMSYGDDC